MRHRRDYGPLLVLGLLIVAFAVLFGLLAVQQHRTFQTNGLDLGNVDQALWNTSRGRLLRFSLMAPLRSRLALHVEPILLLFVPFYWLRLGGPELLLVVQAGVVALGAWPLYLVARHNYRAVISEQEGAVRWVALLFPLAYLLLPTLEAAVLFDFHAVVLAPTFFLFAFWALEQRRDRWFIGFLLLAMACKEDMTLVAAMVGLYAGLARRRWRLAGGVLALSGAWFGVVVFGVQPRFAAGGNIQLGRYAWLGDSLPAMLWTVVEQPGPVWRHLWLEADLPGYLGRLLLPTAFLPLLSPLSLLPLLPSLAINLLSDNPFTWRLEDFHYGAPMAPFLLVSAIYGARRVGQWAARRGRPPAAWLMAVLALVVLYLSLVYHHQRGFTPLARPFAWPQVTAHHRRLEAFVARVPPQAALFAQSNLAPHLTHRPLIYTDFAYFTDPAFPAVGPVDEILLDVTTLENIGGLHQFLGRTLLESDQYRLAAAQDGILHLKRAAGGSARMGLPPAFYTFARPDGPPQYQVTVDFGDRVRLHGYSLHFNRQEEVQVSLELEARQPLGADVQPVLYLLDGQGGLTGATTDVQPGLAWLPPDRWPVGVRVRVRFNTLPWYTRESGPYRLALGLVAGEQAVWDVNRRYRPVVEWSGPYALRLPAGGTLLELARLEQPWGIPQGGPPPRRFTAAPPYPLRANFNNQLRLLGYDRPQVEPGPVLSLRLYWQAVAAPANLTRFVQLVGPDGQLYGQQDSVPDGGAYPTYLWWPGQVVEERVTFPLAAERPPGRYTLHVGLYLPDSGQRLPLLSGGDHVEINQPVFNVR